MKTVLVVEDSNTSRDVTSHFLQQGGFRVLEAEDGQDALEILRTRHVDLILTDIMMPNLDGWGLYREIRSDKSFNLTPFVFLTVLDEIQDQIKGLTLGVDDYLTKPVTPQQLIARVNTALMRSERLSRYFYRNPVTDLATESYFRQRYIQEFDRSRAAKLPLSLVVVGIGNYESLARGHADWFAESASREAGAMLRAKTRSYDVVADMGQGCFALLLPNVDAKHAEQWAKKLKDSWSLSLLWPETEQRIAVDIGFTCDAISPGDHNALELLKKNLASFERKW
ncbi:MAG: response regulator [Zetaproteobacteria bacterium CG2_30_46_52]|nr:MAG: response regulator [Zetaproteobacteria bacterium CG2_30_46_52]